MESAKSSPSVTPSCFQIPPFILDDLCSRFIINIPEEERQDLIRIFFQIELAHWFYLDFYCLERDDLKPCGIKEFSTQVFKHCPTLIPHSDNVDKILESWREYKMAVPTYGAILLDPSLHKCLLVQGFWAKSSWGFPKGKVNEEEQGHVCAIREVLEETGFDISDLIDVEEYIEFRMHEQQSKLYIVPGVPLDTKFQPRTRNEIKRLDWFDVHSLPQHKKDTICKQRHGLNPNAFFMVIPFMRPLKKWITQRINFSTEQSDSSVNSSANSKSVRTPKSKRSTPSEQSGRSSSKQTEFEEYLSNKVPQEYRDTRARLVTRNTPRGGNGSHGNTAKNSGTASPSGKKSRSQTTNQEKNVKCKRMLNMTAQPEKNHTGQRGKSKRAGTLWATAWDDFHFDTDSIIHCMFPNKNSTQQVLTRT